MPRFISHQGGFRWMALCVLSTLSVSACLDAEEGPLAIYVAPETQGAVDLGEELSTVPRLLADYELALEAAVEAEAWQDSWRMEDSLGAKLRGTVHSSVVQLLLPIMGVGGVEDVLAKNAMSIEAAGGLGAMVRSTRIATALVGAEGFHAEAQVALREGRVSEAFAFALQTSDALWRVTPQQVARDLMGKAESALGRNGADGTYSEEELIRIRRLMFGASESLKEGDYPGAIRRAYYACQLLGTDST